MWTCSKCKRIFQKTIQPHSCRQVSLEEHFKNKEKAQKLFDHLVKQIDSEVGEYRLISLPCCVHLFGDYDFLAALPKKDKLEIRFALDRKLNNPQVKQSVPVSTKAYKNCLDLTKIEEINEELIRWLNESYRLKDNH